MRPRNRFLIAALVVVLALTGLVTATTAQTVFPPAVGTPSVAGQAAPEGTVVLGPAEWAVWVNIPGPSRNGTEDCVYSAPTQGGSVPETVQIGWGPLPASGAGGRFPALPAEWLRQWWGNRPDEREAMRGSLEVGLRQVRSDGSQPVCRAVEIEPAVCKPAKTTAALAAGFTLTGDGKYVLFPVTGLDWDSPEVAFMLWTSQSPDCGASTATPSPTPSPSPTVTPPPTWTPSPTATAVPPTPTATPGLRKVYLPDVETCRVGDLPVLVIEAGTRTYRIPFVDGTTAPTIRLGRLVPGLSPIRAWVEGSYSPSQTTLAWGTSYTNPITLPWEMVFGPNTTPPWGTRLVLTSTGQVGCRGPVTVAADFSVDPPVATPDSRSADR